MATIFLMCGFLGAGKTTVSRQLIVEPTPLSWLYRVRTPISAQK